MRYTVKYVAGTYSGRREVFADEEEEAIAQVESWVRKQMVSPMYYLKCSIVESSSEDDDSIIN